MLCWNAYVSLPLILISEYIFSAHSLSSAQFLRNHVMGGVGEPCQSYSQAGWPGVLSPPLLLALSTMTYGRDCILLVAPVGNLTELVLRLSYLYDVFVALIRLFVSAICNNGKRRHTLSAYYFWEIQSVCLRWRDYSRFSEILRTKQVLTVRQISKSVSLNPCQIEAACNTDNLISLCVVWWWDHAQGRHGMLLKGMGSPNSGLSYFLSPWPDQNTPALFPWRHPKISVHPWTDPFNLALCGGSAQN